MKIPYPRGKKQLFLAFILLLFFIPGIYIRSVFMVPNHIMLFEGEEYSYSFNSPILINIMLDREGIVKLDKSGVKESVSYMRLSNPIAIKPQKNGSVSMYMKLLGLISIRTLKVDVVPSREVVACGNTVGVKLKIDGILVIGMSDVETADGRRKLPVMGSGIKPGDLIISANSKKLNGIEDLISEIENSNGNAVKLEYRRGNEPKEAYVKPEKAADDQKYRIGLWVRESTAGIGTLTFFDPDTKSFGALGHGITDIDTGTLIPIESGEILESSILGIKKGKVGIPGELRGIFIENENSLGTVEKNSSYGIYGKLKDEAIKRVPSRIYSIGLKTQVREGPAEILSNINGKKVEAFEVEIQKVYRQNNSGTKGMVLKITDKRLLEATGGIIQGMSGSPIIQNNRIIGAVTHVLVNDPSRGYGIFIESMLNSITGNNELLLQKAG